jgi:hypothetical protein
MSLSQYHSEQTLIHTGPAIKVISRSFSIRIDTAARCFCFCGVGIPVHAIAKSDVYDQIDLTLQPRRLSHRKSPPRCRDNQMCICPPQRHRHEPSCLGASLFELNVIHVYVAVTIYYRAP